MASEDRERDDSSAAEMRMIRWMCDVEVADRFTCSELRERLGIYHIIAVIQRHW